MKLDNVKRIVSDDFKKADRDTVLALGNILNPFMEQIYNGLNKNINIDNLNREIAFVTLRVDSLGVPIIITQFSSKLFKLIGCNVINVINITNPTTYPTSAPFVSFSQVNATLYTINKVNGLSINNQYTLVLELFGA